MVGPGEEYVLPDLLAQHTLRMNDYPGFNMKRTCEGPSFQRYYYHTSDTTTSTPLQVLLLYYENDGANDVPKMKMRRGPLRRLSPQ